MCLPLDSVHVVHSAPRLLIVKVSTSAFRVTCASCHAPHEGTPEQVTTWWTESYARISSVSILDRETPPISFRAVKVVCLVDADLAIPGNLDLVRVDEGVDDVQSDDEGQSERSFCRLARRDWSYLYCGARSVTSDFEE